MPADTDAAVGTLCETLTQAEIVTNEYPFRERRTTIVNALKTPEISVSSAMGTRAVELSEALNQCLSQVASLDATTRCPLICVAGVLNAGKSTLVSALLSPAGQRRVLRGIGNQAGTHRFVIWLPTRWRDDPRLTEDLERNVISLFGQGIERLSEDPQEAFQQYNCPRMNVPLLGFDPLLNDWSVGLIDCPDIQTGILPGENLGPDDFKRIERERSELLGKIGKLASAFLLVTSARALHDNSLTRVYDKLKLSMPRARRYLVVNMVLPRYSPETVQQDVTVTFKQLSFDGIYMAYRFDARDIDSVPEQLRKPPVGAAEGAVPCFFKLPADRTWNPEQVRYLQKIGDELDAGVLGEEHRQQVFMSIADTAQQAVQWLDDNYEEGEKYIRKIWNVLAEGCYRALCDPEDLNRIRIQTSMEVARQFAKMLRDTAPWSLRISLQVQAGFQTVYKLAGQSLEKLADLVRGKWLIRKWLSTRRTSKEEIINAFDLAHHLRLADREGVLGKLSMEDLKCIAGRILEKFRAHDPTLLSDDVVRSVCENYWKTQSGITKVGIGLKPLMYLVGPIIAVIAIPIDFGGTAVLVFASTKELLAALAIGAAGVAVSRDSMGDAADYTIAIQQLSNEVALLCDEIGVPRPTAEQLERIELSNPRIRLKKPTIASPADAATKKPLVQLWRLDPDQQKRLQGLIDNVNSLGSS